jgi:hypothetical protein
MASKPEGAQSPQIRRQILGEVVQLAPGPGRVGRPRPLVELHDREPPVPEGPLEPPDGGLPLDVGCSQLAWHLRLASFRDGFKGRASSRSREAPEPRV